MTRGDWPLCSEFLNIEEVCCIETSQLGVCPCTCRRHIKVDMFQLLLYLGVTVLSSETELCNDIGRRFDRHLRCAGRRCQYFISRGRVGGYMAAKLGQEGPSGSSESNREIIRIFKVFLPTLKPLPIVPHIHSPSKIQHVCRRGMYGPGSALALVEV